MRKFKLKLDHPYAKAGTIVIELLRERCLDGSVTVALEKFPDEIRFDIPYSVEKDWLEEVREEPMCSPAFKKLLEDYIKEHGNDGWVWTGESKAFKGWLDRHTLKTEE